MSIQWLEAVKTAIHNLPSPCILILPILIFQIQFASGHEQNPEFYSELDSLDVELEHARLKRQWAGTQNLWKDLGLPQFWNQYKDGPYGMVIRGWQYAKCASEAWNNYAINVTNLVIWPQYPRFPGPIYFNVTVEVKEDFPSDKLEIEMEVRHAVLNNNNQKGWEVIPCHGWDILSGCGGIGSCRYCDILQKCREAAVKGKKYANDPELRKVLNEPSRLCPPPKGEWTITFNHVIKLEDLPDGFFGPLQSNEYWFTFTLTNGRGRALACARVWMDVCKYHWYDPQQRCLRDPDAFRNFLSQQAG